MSGFFFAAEPSIDFDWIRLRASGVIASGANNPQSGHLGGFDSPFENPQIAGADTSYFIRQSIPLIAEELTNKEIANHFCLSEQTVKNHLYRMKHKVGAANCLDIVQVCRIQGFMV